MGSLRLTTRFVVFKLLICTLIQRDTDGKCGCLVGNEAGAVGEAEEGDREWTPGFWRLTYRAGSGGLAARAVEEPRIPSSFRQPLLPRKAAGQALLITQQGSVGLVSHLAPGKAGSPRRGFPFTWAFSRAEEGHTQRCNRTLLSASLGTIQRPPSK